MVVQAAPGTKNPAVPSAPPEDESADPVGDGHSDADLAERQSPSPTPPPNQKKPA